MSAILILSAGRRVSLVRAFQRAAAARGHRVIAADMSPTMSSACRIAAAAFKLPHVLASDYPQQLEQLCRDEGIGLVVPTLDTELAVLARLRSQFAERGVTIVVSDAQLIDICRDKRRTATHFAALGLPSPALMDRDDLQFPLLVKPFDGSLSKGLHLVESPDDLTPAIMANPRNMFCQYLNPADHDEFTCDCYFDSRSELRCVVPRQRIEVRGGEVSKGRTVNNDIVPLLRRTLGHLEGARGCLTVQMMRHRDSAASYLIEVNPRFGGGYPLTAAAGAAYHAWLIAEYLYHETVTDCDDWQDRLTMLRYDAEVFVSG